ncbi:hypothetical protein Bbelb_440780, partial [Branchiostoma belcheri]
EIKVIRIIFKGLTSGGTARSVIKLGDVRLPHGRDRFGGDKTRVSLTCAPRILPSNYHNPPVNQAREEKEIGGAGLIKSIPARSLCPRAPRKHAARQALHSGTWAVQTGWKRAQVSFPIPSTYVNGGKTSCIRYMNTPGTPQPLI